MNEWTSEETFVQDAICDFVKERREKSLHNIVLFQFFDVSADGKKRQRKQ